MHTPFGKGLVELADVLPVNLYVAVGNERVQRIAVSMGPLAHELDLTQPGDLAPQTASAVLPLTQVLMQKPVPRMTGPRGEPGYAAFSSSGPILKPYRLSSSSSRMMRTPFMSASPSRFFKGRLRSPAGNPTAFMSDLSATGLMCEYT